jgi:hypothetical protein
MLCLVMSGVLFGGIDNGFVRSVDNGFVSRVNDFGSVGGAG